MYNTVDGKFHKNLGTGDFVVGFENSAVSYTVAKVAQDEKTDTEVTEDDTI